MATPRLTTTTSGDEFRADQVDGGPRVRLGPQIGSHTLDGLETGETESCVGIEGGDEAVAVVLTDAGDLLIGSERGGALFSMSKDGATFGDVEETGESFKELAVIAEEFSWEFDGDSNAAILKWGYREGVPENGQRGHHETPSPGHLMSDKKYYVN